eukprot:scaffold3456_cov340-Prasinococcus_capsulatus_cf.AAC.3
MDSRPPCRAPSSPPPNGSDRRSTGSRIRAHRRADPCQPTSASPTLVVPRLLICTKEEAFALALLRKRPAKLSIVYCSATPGFAPRIDHVDVRAAATMAALC